MSKKNPPPKAETKGSNKKETPKVITDNRRARHEYEILDVLECGIALVGTEVKSMRQGLANLQDSHARIENGEVWLYNCHVSPYDHGNRFNHDPDRKRRLLLHKAEIRKLKAKVQEKGLSLIPLKLYFNHNRAKVALALCRGKKIYDKRDSISKRDSQRQLERTIKSRRYE
ncbi:MAG: SsrA-binding protein SmpB [Candidatus Obscuribacterales bacterium]|nr:SsrA-binding protein SmpB [Candidatus Obscuribacterales bacterium]